MAREFWQQKKVFLTGHTGFKGGWLATWLLELGAQVVGYALKPETEPSYFVLCGLDAHMESVIGDVREEANLKRAMQDHQPDIVFHLAAQAIVRKGYLDPVLTFATNIMGTVHLLEVVRHTPSVRAVVVVTSDKCYENREWVWSYRENEALGGDDPYSSSKACSEILTAAWRRSYLDEAGVAVATVRAGNVIGGGDWGTDRLIPDFFRALDHGEMLRIRSPDAIRPWQHVLEPLSGYLKLAECLYIEGRAYAEGWNFGPADEDACTVRWVVERLVAAFPGVTWECERGEQSHEAQHLKLDNSKARASLGWRPRWQLLTALDKTMEWHEAWRHDKDMRAVSLAQIAEYTASKPAS